ncbi:MAG TPA: Ig-like domain-containing protein [Thermoanaerobaculia bacterium]|nr:Ig-like domain-containing protein [Thermoanaerobaculia bacterium]
MKRNLAASEGIGLRKVIAIAVVIAAIGAFGALPCQAAAPFGSFGGKVGGGNGADGSLPLFGWALASNGVAAVDILVDGIIDGRATYGRSRPGVQALYPNYPDSAAAGWAYSLNTTHYLNGIHTISARVRSKSGETADLKGQKFQFDNTPADLGPFGKIEFPNANAELFGDCGQQCAVGTDIVLANPRRYNVVSGWAVDTGVNPNDSGIGYVELLIDRALFSPSGYSSKIGCFYAPQTGGLTNCYGMRRLDIANQFPTLRDSLHSGFRFVLDVSQLINCNLYDPGHHTLTIRAGDQFGTVREIAEIPVTFSCADYGVTDPSVGQIDIPPAGLLYSGTVQVTGWALDYQGITLVTLLVDGNTQGTGFLTLPRPGISALYPGYPQSATPGFSLPLDTHKLSNGVHSIQVIASDTLGSDTLLGEVRVTVANTGQ